LARTDGGASPSSATKGVEGVEEFTRRLARNRRCSFLLRDLSIGTRAPICPKKTAYGWGSGRSHVIEGLTALRNWSVLIRQTAIRSVTRAFPRERFGRGGKFGRRSWQTEYEFIRFRMCYLKSRRGGRLRGYAGTFEQSVNGFRRTDRQFTDGHGMDNWENVHGFRERFGQRRDELNSPCRYCRK